MRAVAAGAGAAPAGSYAARNGVQTPEGPRASAWEIEIAKAPRGGRMGERGAQNKMFKMKIIRWYSRSSCRSLHFEQRERERDERREQDEREDVDPRRATSTRRTERPLPAMRSTQNL